MEKKLDQVPARYQKSQSRSGTVHMQRHEGVNARAWRFTENGIAQYLAATLSAMSLSGRCFINCIS